MATRPSYVDTVHTEITEVLSTGVSAVRNPTATTNTVVVFTAQNDAAGSLLRKITLQHIGAAAASGRIHVYIAPTSASTQLEMISNQAAPSADGQVVIKFYETGNDGMPLPQNYVVRVGLTGTNVSNDIYSAIVEGGDF